MHWADVLANELLENEREHTLATGITPSGPIHIGNLREVLTTEAVHRALEDHGADATLLYIGDTYDPLRNVPPFLEDHANDYEEHLGRPISDIPAPNDAHDSYAEAFLAPFLDALDRLGIQPTTHLAHELYEEGSYTDAIRTALEHADTIRRTLNEESGRELPPEWVPFNPRCATCGRIGTTTVTSTQDTTITYACEHGHEGTLDALEPGAGKLPWRVDWPARWALLDVTFEAFGKDHAASGGSWDTGAPIARDVYGIQPPHHTVYEWISVKGQGAMSSSQGTGIAAEAVLDATPPEALRFFFMRYQPEKHIEFDAGQGMLDLVDDYDKALEALAHDEPIPEINDARRVLELSQPSGAIPKHPTHTVPMRHLATLVQIYDDTDDVLASVERSGHIDDLTPQEESHLRTRIEHTRHWTRTFAPDHLTFTLAEETPHGKLQAVHREHLQALLHELESTDWDADAIQNAVYAASQALDTSPGGVFKAAYLALLGQTGGPRLGPFLAGLERDWALERLHDAAESP